jgi:hypothetical protein
MKRIATIVIAVVFGGGLLLLAVAGVVGYAVAEPASYMLPDSLVSRATRVADWVEGHAGADRETPAQSPDRPATGTDAAD